MSTERVVSLSHRFSAVQQSISEIVGNDLGFAAASSAWLQAIQNVLGYILDRAISGDSRQELDATIEHLLQSYHSELCKHLKVDQQKAIDLGVNFHEVIKDIVNEKG